MASTCLSAHCLTFILSVKGPQPIRWSQLSGFRSLGLVPGSVCHHVSLLRTSDNDLHQGSKALRNTGKFVMFVRRQRSVLLGRLTGWWDPSASEQLENINPDGEKSLERAWKEDKGQGVSGCQVRGARGTSSSATRYGWLDVETQGGKRVCPNEHK